MPHVLSVDPSLSGNTRTLVLDVELNNHKLNSGSFGSLGNCIWEIFFDANIGEVTVPPSIKDPAVSNSGGFLPSQTSIFTSITVLDNNGKESPPVAFKMIKTGPGDLSSLVYTLPPATNVASYNIYAGIKPHMESFVGNFVPTSSNSTFLLKNLPSDSKFNAIKTRPYKIICGAGSTESVLFENTVIQKRLQVFATVLGANAKSTLSLILS